MISELDKKTGEFVIYYSTKKCCRCHKVKNESEYVKCPRYRDGHFSHCRVCDNARKEGYYDKNKELMNQKRVKWGKESGYTKWYTERYKNRAAVLRKAAYEKLKSNKEALDASQKRANELRRNRLKNDPVFRFSMNARCRISNSLRERDIEKTLKFDDLLGCTHRQAVHYLTGGGFEIPKEIHIDHYIPVAFFDLTKESEQRVCFNWRNLQLLTPKENQEKNAKLPSDYKQKIAEICKAIDVEMEIR